jgi:hypothetical protein
VLAVAGLVVGAATYGGIGLLSAVLLAVAAYAVDLVMSLSARRHEVTELKAKLAEAELAVGQTQSVLTDTRDELDVAKARANALRDRVGAPLGSLEEAAFLVGRLGGAVRAAVADQQRLVDDPDAVRWPVLRFVLQVDGTVAAAFDAELEAVSGPVALLGPDGEPQINGMEVRAEAGGLCAPCLLEDLPAGLQAEIELYGAMSPSGYSVTLAGLVAEAFRGVDAIDLANLAQALDDATQAINQTIVSRGSEHV